MAATSSENGLNTDEGSLLTTLNKYAIFMSLVGIKKPSNEKVKAFIVNFGQALLLSFDTDCGKCLFNIFKCSPKCIFYTWSPNYKGITFHNLCIVSGVI